MRSSRRLINAWAVGKVAARASSSCGILPAAAAPLIAARGEAADCCGNRRRLGLSHVARRPPASSPARLCRTPSGRKLVSAKGISPSRWASRNAAFWHF